MLNLIVFAILCGLVGHYADKQGREWGWWVLWAAVFSPLLVAIVLLCLGDKK
jgi:hypothetical protein